MKIHDPFERPRVEVHVDGEWLPGVERARVNWPGAPPAWRGQQVLVQYQRVDPDHPAMGALEYVDWFPASQVRLRDESS